MPYKSQYTHRDYLEFAEKHNLIFYGNKHGRAPKNVKLPARYRCKRCGLEFSATMTSMKRRKYPCICYSGVSVQDYLHLATDLGIIWLWDGKFDSQSLPTNNKTKTRWLARDGKTVVLASYNQLASNPTKELLRRLGVET